MAQLAPVLTASTQPFVLVSLAKRRRLVRLSEVHEIVPMLQLEAMDDAKGRCRGLFNLRGEIVPVFDLAGRDAPLSASRFILIGRGPDGAFGLLVDDVVRVLHVAADALVVRSLDGDSALECAEIDGEVVTVFPMREAGRP